jgi:dihydroorotate dehydrogenase
VHVLYEKVARPVLFRIGKGDAETAHEATLATLERIGRRPSSVTALRTALGSRAPKTPRTVFGVTFPGPVGLAAGMDKDGRALAAWPALGFGFVEVGTVTAEPQPGNDKPRVFRLRESEAIINRMGFNNRGAAQLAYRLREVGKLPIPLGISLGKSKVTPIGDAIHDYVTSLRALNGLGDYFAINVSSPNTPNLRTLQDAGTLRELIMALKVETTTPLLVKIAPDLTDGAIAQLLEVCAGSGVDGLIATNTTLDRAGLVGADVGRAGEAGGLSGRPLAVRAREVVAFVHRETSGNLPIIGVGGISSADDAKAMMDAGASLIQVYSALIFQGAGLINRINRAVR